MNAPFTFDVTHKLMATRPNRPPMWVTELTTSDGQSVRFYNQHLSAFDALEKAVDNDMLIAPED